MMELERFVNKVVIVTGAGHGIGRAIAERFGREGASVVVNDVDEARAHQVAQAIPGGQAIAVAADVSNKKQVDALFDAAVARFGTVDVLVNNAGNIHAARHFLEGDEEWWDKLLGVNVKGAFLCSHRAAHIMARQGFLVSSSFRRFTSSSEPTGLPFASFASCVASLIIVLSAVSL
jgi:NAD(P)-dependent dehydrogenase (short-subunit alcohol dehydrogenase family)